MRQRKRNKLKILRGWNILAGISSGLIFAGLGILFILLLRLLPWGGLQSSGILNDKGKEILAAHTYPVFLGLLLYLIIMVFFIFLLIIRLKKQDYGILFCASIGSVILPAILSILLGIGSPEPFRTLHQIILSLEIYVSAPEAAGFPGILNTVLQCLILLVPGILAFTVFLICYFKWKRAHADEYEMPRKQNYYYI